MRDLPPTIDVAELDRRLSSSDEPRAMLVDVRELAEIVAVRIDGLVVMPLSQFASRYQELPTDRHSWSSARPAAGPG